MANDNLTSQTIASTYNQLLITADTGGITGSGSSATQIHCGAATAGAGNADTTPLYLSTTRVGIGTVSPSVDLHVENTGNAELLIKGADGVATLTLDAHGTDKDAALLFKLDNASKFHIGVDDSDNDYFKIGRGSALGTTTAITIDSNSNVGIGTASPTYTLDVETTTATEYAASIVNLHSTNGHGLLVRGGDNADVNAFHVQDYDGGENLFIVLGDGKTGIGAAAPSYRFTVVDASTEFAAHITNTTDGGEGLYISTASAGGEQILQCVGDDDSGDVDAFQVESVGKIKMNAITSTTGTDLIWSGGFVYKKTSAGRFKTNIEDINIGLDFVNQLRPVSYDNIEECGGASCVGFIAEDVEVLDKRLVTYDDADGKDGLELQSVQYGDMVSVLTKAIQELSAKVTALENA